MQQESMGTAFRTMAAFVLIILILWLIARTRIGYTVEYYAVALMILLILVTQYKRVASILNIGNLPQTVS